MCAILALWVRGNQKTDTNICYSIILYDVLVTQKNCLCIDDSYKNIDCYTLQHIVDMIYFDEYDLTDFRLVEIPNSDTFHFQNSKNNKHFFVIRIYGQPDIHMASRMTIGRLHILPPIKK